MRIRVNSVDCRGSIVDGPGIRTVVFLQGCDKKCEGCHNPSTWASEGGYLMEVRSLAELLKENAKNGRITISGGEPLLQYDAVLELTSYLHGYDVTLYTGREFEEVPEELLNRLTYVKVGKFIKSLASTTLAYIGSSNQQFIDLRGSA